MSKGGTDLAITGSWLGARFAPGGRASPPPVHPRKHDHHDPADHRHAYRPHKSNFSLAFGLTIALVAVCVGGALGLVGREPPPSFGELKTALGISVAGGVPTFDIEQVDFINRLDGIGCSRQAESFEGPYLYLYYKVREGQAQIVLDRSAWQVGKARIKQIALR